jgi:hypothetical protein
MLPPKSSSVAAFALALAAFSLPAGAGSAAALASYRFSGGPKDAAVGAVADSGPNRLTGAGVGALTYSSDIPVRSAGLYSLNATRDFDYVTVPDAAALRPAGSFTLTAWVRPTGSQSDVDAIVAKKTGVQVGTCLTSYGLSYAPASGKFLALICGSSNPNAPSTFVVSKDTYAKGDWHLVKFKYTYNPTKKTASMMLSVDGAVEGKVALTSFPGIFYGSGPFLIGAGNYGSGDHDNPFRRNFVGYIDEIKLTSP